MFTAASPRIQVAFWCGVTVFLLAWNGVLASYGNPLLLLQQHDGAQYHLLVRNRLAGHYEVGDSAHTVGAEGQNPIWLPGLVWIEEGLARCLGSVQASAAIASALGGTLMELAMLWLAAVCFGRKVVLLVLLALVLPLVGSGFFIRMAVGQGPEAWAAAALTAGLASLVVALRRGSGWWAVGAGGLAGLAEWFRAGSYLVFIAPCLFYALACLWRRQRKLARIPALALVIFGGVVFVSGLLIASRVNKTVVALTHRLQEKEGSTFIYRPTDDIAMTVYLSGLQLAANGVETQCDYAVNQASGVSTLAFLGEHRDKIAAIYFDGLCRAVTSMFWGVRELVGGQVFVCFACGLLLSLFCRKEGDVHALALSAGAMAHYFGPIVLLRGPDLTHYLTILLPLFFVVAAYGAVQAVDAVHAVVRRVRPSLVDREVPLAWPHVAVGLATVLVLTVRFFYVALGCVNEAYEEAQTDRAAVAALHLEGHKVACRSMGWFVDADVQLTLLPYATVPELAHYATANGLDGILLWEKEDERYVYFFISPYSNLSAFHQALAASGLFETPRVSGPWHWYPVRQARPYEARKGAAGKVTS